MLVCTYLEVDDDGKDQNGGKQIHQIGQILTVERFAECANFVGARSQEMEECDDTAFEFCAAANVDGRWTEGFPNDCFTDVRGNEE